MSAVKLAVEINDRHVFENLACNVEVSCGPMSVNFERPFTIDRVIQAVSSTDRLDHCGWKRVFVVWSVRSPKYQFGRKFIKPYVQAFSRCGLLIVFNDPQLAVVARGF